MKILFVHNYYQQPGGEDQAFADQAWLLERHGHDVRQYTVHNDAVDGMNRLALAGRTLWNRQTYRELRALIQRERIELVHCMNTFPLISPAAYYAAHAAGAAVVQEVQNYRLFCPGAFFMRDGRVCTDCLGKRVPWPAVRHRCYRDSRAATGVVATLLTSHRLAGSWQRKVDRYIAVTQFSRHKFMEGGLPADRIAVKPNFVHPDPGPGDGLGGYAIFVGRLSPEKGLETLLSAWEQLPGNYPLKIVGDGPLAERVQAAATRNPAIQWLGRQPLERVCELVGQATCLVFPSLWYEGLPKTILESFAKGTPVVASNLGAMSEVIEDGYNGVHFTPGDASELAAKLMPLLLANDGDHTLRTMRRAARDAFEQHYTPEVNYPQLLAIYEAALARQRN
ncbi:glycosyltransferase family 4 protein [Phycisphaerales bacterium AB-hyl4]|uniref:Glycosyltransferase family 4 protein n=1 Tax=Natronomicrosphaera hydrolytica TaxID=3242702 RepID=A0ABV4U3V4_9BACT